MVQTRSQTVTPTSTPGKEANGSAYSNGTVYSNGSPTKKRKAQDANGITPAKRPRDEKTDLTRWRLLDEHGRQTWHYLESEEEAKKWPQSVADRHFLGLHTVCARIQLSWLSFAI